MPGDAPMEMDPEFVRLVGECECAAMDLPQPGIASERQYLALRETTRLALHRWHREQVERAVAADRARREWAAQELCRIYFEIAESAVGTEEVVRRREAAIDAAIEAVKGAQDA